MPLPRIEIWAENISELLYFLDRIIRSRQTFNIESLFVAKGGIGSSYLTGEYREYSHVERDVLDTTVIAPGTVTDLVQWCCPDIIITKNRRPIFVLEFTSHLPQWNNVAQRLPRLVRAAASEVPSIIFHKCDEGNPKKSWVAEVFRRVSHIYRNFSLPIFFDDENFDAKTRQLVTICNEIVDEEENPEVIFRDILEEATAFSEGFSQDEFEFDRRRGLRRAWLPRITNDLVEVHISVQQQCGHNVCEISRCRNDSERAEMRRRIRTRNRNTEHGCMWLTKGTGGLDPYPGLIKLAEILCCYNDDGERVKNIITKFRELPENFWWFCKYPDGLYYRLIKEFSDEVLYMGQSRTLYTQTSMIIKTRKYLSSKGWTVLYDDLPGGSRSGIGKREQIFQTFTSLFGAYPDIICMKDEKVIIIEANSNLNEYYVNKLNTYLQNSEQLSHRLGEISKRNITSIDVGFAKTRYRYNQNERIDGIKRFFLDENSQVTIDN